MLQNTFYKVLIISILSCCVRFSFGQQEKINEVLFAGNYISDGQYYTAHFDKSKTLRFYLSFFEGFQYRVIINAKDCKKYQITLYDIEKKVLFSGACDSNIKWWDFNFKSTLACIAEIKALGDIKPEATLFMTLGFKELNRPITK